jgi:hypothetical protein
VDIQHNEFLPPIIVLHHLFVRAFPVISLPPWHFNWNESQYSDWLDANPNGAIQMMEKCLDIYAEEIKRRGEKEYCIEYPIIRNYLNSLK